MNVLGLFFAIVPLLVADEVTGEAACPNKTWDPRTDGQWTRCVYYCPDGKGGWEMGYFRNGTVCSYTPEKNGTCYNGLCYGSLPDNVNLPSVTVSDEVFVTDKQPDSTPDETAPTTTTKATTTTQKEKNKTKEKKETKKKKKKKKEKKEKKEEDDNKEKKKKKGKKKKEATPQEW
ncbi:uncharacterized protein LOC119446619 [Dermacentor silvarum]|uniref:uncharacterized protein LOC119446619 n=1 Tax=Dermacentor silvarum TaxID=543639 RepID=UPI00189BEEB5|nr:uncharacterized protein LOC119446619 [Dermacentor silvarum]